MEYPTSGPPARPMHFPNRRPESHHSRYFKKCSSQSLRTLKPGWNLDREVSQLFQGNVNDRICNDHRADPGRRIGTTRNAKADDDRRVKILDSCLGRCGGRHLAGSAPDDRQRDVPHLSAIEHPGAPRFLDHPPANPSRSPRLKCVGNDDNNGSFQQSSLGMVTQSSKGGRMS